MILEDGNEVIKTNLGFFSRAEPVIRELFEEIDCSIIVKRI
jgi:hypothetical protein